MERTNTEAPWGSVRGILTYRDWLGAFSLGMLVVLYAFNVARDRKALWLIAFVGALIAAVRGFLEFRRKLRIVTDAATHGE